MLIIKWWFSAYLKCFKNASLMILKRSGSSNYLSFESLLSVGGVFRAVDVSVSQSWLYCRQVNFQLNFLPVHVWTNKPQVSYQITVSNNLGIILLNNLFCSQKIYAYVKFCAYLIDNIEFSRDLHIMLLWYFFLVFL